MKLPGKGTLAANAIALGFILVLYVGDVYDYVRAQTADVSALRTLPNITYAGLILAFGIVIAALAVLAIVQQKPATSKIFRLLPIVALVGIFVDLFVLSADAPIISSADHMSMSLQAFQNLAQQRASTEQVPSSERDLYDLVPQLGTPPYLVKGQPAAAYAVQRRENCTGPISEAPGAQVGTFLYCVAPNRKMAWITVVGLPYEERFGSPKVLSRGGVPLVLAVTPQAPDVLPSEEGELPMGEGEVEAVPDAGSPLPLASDAGS